MKIEPDALKVTGVVSSQVACEMLNAHLIDLGTAVVDGKSLLVYPDNEDLRDQRDYDFFEAVVLQLLHDRGEAGVSASLAPSD